MDLLKSLFKSLVYAFYLTCLCSLSMIQLTLHTSHAHAELVDRIVAVVNDQVITLSELQKLMIPVYRNLQSMSDPIQRNKILRKQSEEALDQLIGQTLLTQQAEEQGISITDEQTEAYIKSLMNQQGWSEQDLQAYLNAQGMTRAALKEESKKRLMQQTVFQRLLGNKMAVSETELQSAYQDYLTEIGSQVSVVGSHLFLAIPPGSDAAAEAAIKQQATDLMRRIKEGEDFTTLVKQYGQHDHPEGDLGSITRNSGLPKELEDGFFALKEQEVGGPIRTPFGYHIIKNRQIKKMAAPTFEEVRAQLEMRSRQKKQIQNMEAIIDKLKESSFIDIRL